MFDAESEDEDGLPIPDKKLSKGSKKKAKFAADQVRGAKRKSEEVQAGEIESRETENPEDSSMQSSNDGQENAEKPKKKKKKERTLIAGDNRATKLQLQRKQRQQMEGTIQMD